MSAAARTFFWYDLETSGLDPRWHRILQFAGIRTDENLEEVGAPIAHYVKLPIDVLPEPAACVVTGLTPQLVNEKGLPELEAHVGIHREFSVPGTCVAGFNNLRFDDEFIRYGFYRHLLDPYAREWRNGNSRWDLIDLVRAAGALRPEGIEWPLEEGLPVFNLGALAEANGVPHVSAHDALSDVRATLALARIVRQRQRRLYEYYLTLRDKSRVQALLDWRKPQICLHVSGMLGRERWNLAPIMPLAKHPTNNNSVIVVDLGRDVGSLLTDDAETLREKLFAKGDHERPPLKEVRLNRVPFVAPLTTLRPEDGRRLNIDLDVAKHGFELLKGNSVVRRQVAGAYEPDVERHSVDVDAALYDGFVSDADRALCDDVLKQLLEGKSVRAVTFADARLGPLVWRARARGRYESLGKDERTRWRAEVKQKLLSEDSRAVSLAAFRAQIQALRSSAEGLVLDSLDLYAADLERWLEGSA